MPAGIANNEQEIFSERKTAYQGSNSILYYFFARDIGAIFAIAALILFALETGLQFSSNFNHPVGGAEGAKFFPERLNYQNVDSQGWILTGFLLPYSSLEIRAPRPLYPLIITFFGYLGVLTPLSSDHDLFSSPAYLQSLRLLQFSNILLTLASLWIFFTASRYFGFSAPAALMAAILSGSGFGFSFWTVQAVPEVLSYFSVAAALMGFIWAGESRNKDELQGSSLARWSLAGFMIGILVLGKELYFLNVFGALLLAWKRRWICLLLFAAASAFPTLLWRYYIVNVAEIFSPQEYHHKFGFFTWLGETLLHAPLMEKIQLLSNNFNGQIISFLRAFVYIPVFFMIIGMIMRPIRGQGMPLLLFFISFSIMFFTANFMQPRLMFLAWPIVYFFAWKGIASLAEVASRQLPIPSFRPCIRRGMEVVIIGLLIWLQNLPLYEAYFYG